ncbi:MAG: hypothetical protein RR949_06575, partial [Oscillospiraceae bacterium]
AANSKTPAEDGLKIAALTVARWLRARFREFDLPEALKLPDPADYSTIDCAQLPSFHLSMGYTVDVVSLPEEGAWTMQLIEPDLGSDPTNPHQERAPVPGRILETNVAFRIVGKTLECGFQTLASEPEGTEERCEVFRPVFVKELCRNPLVGLTQGYPIEDRLWLLNSGDKLKQLRDYLKTGTLPAVVIAERKAPAQTGPNLAALQEIKLETMPVSPLMRTLGAETARQLGTTQNAPDSAPQLPYDTTSLTRFKMGYAQFFQLPDAQRGEFAKIFKLEIGAGETLLLEPLLFGGGCISYPDPGAKSDGLLQKLDSAVQEYPKRKPVSFDRVWFLADAKLRQQEQLGDAKHLAADTEQQQSAKAALLKSKYEAELLMKDTALEQLRGKIVQFQAQIDDARERTKAVQAEADGRVAQAEDKLRRQEDTLCYYRSLSQRPTTTVDIPAWVNRCFGEHMLFHQKAIDLITKTPTGEVDMKLLCDALEYLATEYWACNEGQMSEDAAMSRCSEKYGRPFEVCP